MFGENRKKLLILISGNGTNLQAVIDAIHTKILPDTDIVGVISNKRNAYGLERAKKCGIQSVIVPKLKKETREKYDEKLLKVIFENFPRFDLIVLAGWMRILSGTFLNQFKPGTIINLHPALPGEFPGADGIGQAYAAFKNGTTKHTGLMVHEVVEEIDAGKVLETSVVPIYPNDSRGSLSVRVKKAEKPALIKAIYAKLFGVTGAIKKEKRGSGRVVVDQYVGKVRCMHDIHLSDTLVMEHSDRLSAFDRQICIVPEKGKMLCKISNWWFKKSQHIIPNHLMFAKEQFMFVKKCSPILLEVVVRGYITGSTKTSLWTHYENGDREYCGYQFPEGLTKNQKLPINIVTPTTKGTCDVPLSGEDIVSRKILSKSEWEYIRNKALQLFEFGQQISEKKGYILADTKYEFGRDSQGNIILIDEMHTPDSSRYWIKDTYQGLVVDQGKEPQKIDKDAVRDYLKFKLGWNPYDKTTSVPYLDPAKLQQISKVYLKILHDFTGGTTTTTSEGVSCN